MMRTHRRQGIARRALFAGLALFFAGTVRARSIPVPYFSDGDDDDNYVTAPVSPAPDVASDRGQGLRFVLEIPPARAGRLLAWAALLRWSR